MTTANPRMPMPIAGTPGDIPEIDALAINTIRTLSMDAVQAANSGHPGTPMALAPVAYALWQHVLNFDPADPHAFLGEDRRGIRNPPGAVVDVDDEIDLLVAEAILARDQPAIPGGAHGS